MGKSISYIRIHPSIFAVFLLLLNIFPEQKENIDLQKIYWNAKFSVIVNRFQKKDYKSLSIQEKLLYIECLARTAQGTRAMGKIKQILADHPPSCEILTTAGIVYFSNGRLDEAKKYIDRALILDPVFTKAILTKVMLLLYYQQFIEAKNLYRELKKNNPEWKNSYLFYRVGIEVYSVIRDSQRLGSLYNEQARKYKYTNKRQHDYLRKNSKLLKNALKRKIFHVETGSEKVTLPFAEQSKNIHYSSFVLKIKGRKFKVILDTGNTVGWIIHSRELKELLKSKRGGRIKTLIGREAGMLDGYHIYSDHVDFGNLKVNHLTGLYLPKPHPSYHDANLNPVFIRDRVVTINFVRKQVILRSKERFDRDLDSLVSKHSESFSILPWYGYENVFVPCIAEREKEGLAMIETGAEDIALRLGFARQLPLALQPKVKYLANGEVLQYSITPIKISAGRFRFDREAAEVWPLKRFYDRITGMGADVVIGPTALKGRMIVSFDPFGKQVVLSEISF